MPIPTELLVNTLTNKRMPYPNRIGEVFHIAVEDPDAARRRHRTSTDTKVPIITVKAVLVGHRLEWRYVRG